MAFEVQTYTDLSDQIQTRKEEVIEALSSLHDDLCALAQLEKQLENERVKGIDHTGLLSKNSAELAGPLDAYQNQIQVPTRQIWSVIDGAISTIYAHNHNARPLLPELFSRINRIDDFTGKAG